MQQSYALRFTNKLALFGIQVRESFPLYSERSFRRLLDAYDDDEAAEAVEDIQSEQLDEEKAANRKAVKVGLIVSAVIGAIVAAIATLFQKNQLVFVLSTLFVIQAAGHLWLYYSIKGELSFAVSDPEIPSYVRSNVTRYANYMLSKLRMMLLIMLPVGIAERFLFTCIFLLFFSYMSNDLGSIEQFMQSIVTRIASFTFGATHASEGKVFGTLLTTVLTFGGSTLLQVTVAPTLTVKQSKSSGSNGRSGSRR